MVNPPDGLPYCVMEYVDGSALGTVICTQGYLPADDAVAPVIQVANGLATAHPAGLVN